MMNIIYSAIEKKNCKKDKKNSVFILFNILFWAFAGLVVYKAFGYIFFPQIEGLVCFVGYPGVFIGFYGSLIYLYRKQK